MRNGNVTTGNQAFYRDVTTGRICQTCARAQGDADVTSASVDGSAIGHGDRSGTGIPVGILNAVGSGLVGGDGESAVIGGDVGVEQDAASGLKGQAAAVACCVVDGDVVADGDIVVGLDGDARAAAEGTGQV